jgi:S-formylglutathione hydrolase FrmB
MNDRRSRRLLAQGLPRFGRRGRIAALATLVAVFLAVGGYGADLYGRSFWKYRSFPRPVDPPSVVAHGRLVSFTLISAALGGRSRPVYVYLPPGYDRNRDRRYPVLYLLHGVPGIPSTFVTAGAFGVREDVLVNAGLMQPCLLVMPSGSFGFTTDTEWVDGIRHGESWETYLARDVVGAIDRRYRTIADGSDRGIAGLSEGGYGALNIAIHHPGEFRVVEGWIPYALADRTQRQIFGTDRRRLHDDSPLLTVPAAAAALRKAHTFFWLLIASEDPLRWQTIRFADELRRLGIPYRLVVGVGKHRWGFIRPHAGEALLAASAHLGHA